jgi:hypothetical protein
VDVANIWVVEEWLEPGKAVNAIEDRVRDPGLGYLVQGLATVGVGARRKPAEFAREELASQRPFVCR